MHIKVVLEMYEVYPICIEIEALYSPRQLSIIIIGLIF